MSDKKTERLVSELLKGSLPPGKEARIKASLKKKGMDPGRLAEYEKIWDALAEERIPEPSEGMPVRFRQALDEAKKTAWRSEPGEAAARNPFRRPGVGLVPRWAFGFSLVVIGWFIGYQLTPRPERSRLETLNAEMREMKTAIFLTKMDSASASERMSAVHYAEDDAAWDDTVREALVRALNFDANANVRLTALETLARRTDDARVRDALVQSIANQDSPLLFLGLADIMLDLKDARAIEPFKKIIADPVLYFSVRQKLEETVRRLT
jgi:hypothetical protein